MDDSRNQKLADALDELQKLAGQAAMCARHYIKAPLSLGTAYDRLLQPLREAMVKVAQLIEDEG